MKKELTAAQLAELTAALGCLFEQVEVTDPTESEAGADGLCVGYEHTVDDLSAVITRVLRVDGADRLLRLRGVLSSLEPGVTARELSLYRDDMLRDFLTGVYNRAYWDARMMPKLNAAAAAGRPAAVALVRVDGYDAMLEQYGSEDTDQLVCYVANLWKRYYDEGDEKTVCRMGETTFAIVCFGADEPDLAGQLQYIYGNMNLVCTSTHGMLRCIPFTLSMACAGLNEVQDQSATGLYKAASRRLAAVVKAGGNAVAQV